PWFRWGDRLCHPCCFSLPGLSRFYAHAFFRSSDVTEPRYHMVDVNGVTPRPPHPLINPHHAALIDQGIHDTYHMAPGKPCHGSKILIANPCIFPIAVGFGTNGVE